jgi:hypothetical protein
MSISGGAAVGAAASMSGALRPETFPNNQYVQAKVTGSTFSKPAIVARGSTGGGGGATGYAVHAWTGFSESEVEVSFYSIWKLVDGVETQLGANVEAGDILEYVRLDVSGTTLTLKGGHTSSGFSVLDTRTDSAVTAGAAGIRNYASGAASSTIDEFSAGSL